jgi:catechol 2,3-dioxygenase-like lactoylglutathione lyase family enzyme
MAFVVDRIHHVVLNCRDVDATTDWYVRVLGMRREVFGDGPRPRRQSDRSRQLFRPRLAFMP